MIFVFDGLDGCGKTTYIKRLQDVLEERGMKVKTFRNPGGTQFGEIVRPIVKGKAVKRGRLVDMLTLAANWIDIMEQATQYVKDGYVVLIDRGPMSAYAYQGHLKGLSLYVDLVYDLLLPVYQRDSVILRPDVLFYIDVPYHLLTERLGERTDVSNEMYEGKDEQWFNTLKLGYDEFYQNANKRKSFSALLQRSLHEDEVMIESTPIFGEIVRVSPTDNTKHEHNRLLTIFKEKVDEILAKKESK